MKGKVIAVDFDRTLTQSETVFPELSTPNYQLVRKLREWSKENTIIIWTSRSGKHIEPMIEYLLYHDIPFHYINDNPLNPYIPQSRKLFADVYIDDKAVNLNYMDINLVEEIAKEG